MNLWLRVTAVAVLLLLLPIPSLLDRGLGVPTEAHAAPSPPAPSTAIALTNTSYDNYFLPGMPSGTSNSRPPASAGVVAWRNTRLAGYPCSAGQPTVITYSALNASSGKLVARNLTAPSGYGLPSCSDANPPRGSDNGRIFTQVLQNSNSTTPSRSILVLDAQDGTSSVIPCPNPSGRTSGNSGCGFADPVISTWGSYVLTLKSYPRLFAWDFVRGTDIWYNTTEIAQAVGGQWQQLTPNDQYISSSPTNTCKGNDATFQSLIDLSTPTQVVARGPGQYAWIRFDYKPQTFVTPCGPTPGVVAMKAEILLESGEVVASFFPTGTYSGKQCSGYNDTICNFTIVGAWGNLVLYAVANGPPSYAYNLWLYDASKHTSTRLPMSSSDVNLATISGISSDGRSLIMNNSTQVILYDPSSGTKVLRQNATFVRASNGWAFWQNRTGDVNLFDFSKQRLYSEDIIRGATSAQFANLPATVDFYDGVAAWVSIQLTGSTSPAYVPILYVLDPSHLDPASGNLTQVTARVPLDWAKVYTSGGYRVGEVHVSKGWVFLSAVPKWSNFLQIFAFQPLGGRVGVTVGGSFLPLNEVRVDVLQNSGATVSTVATTYTDDHGSFSVLVPEGLSAASPPYSFAVNLTQRDGKFQIREYSGNNSVSAPHVVNSVITMTTSDLSVIKVSENFVNIDFTTVATLGSMTTTASRVSYARSAAYDYYLAFQSYRLLRDVLNSGYMIDKTLQIRVFSSVHGAFFTSSGGSPYINLDSSNSIIGNSNAPMNTVWHEFGHAVMWYSPIGGVHAFPPRAVGDGNHRGYRNSESTDAWTEGWAEFYSTMVGYYVEQRADANVYRCCGGATLNLDRNNTIWGVSPWPYEELAVAGVLWDIPNLEPVPDRDTANIPLVQMWNTLTTGAPTDVHGVWNLFKGYGGVNQTFVWHDIYNDTNGNGRWDPGEPIGTSSWALVNSTAGFIGTTNPTTIASATLSHKLIIPNTGRGNRQDLPAAPGSQVLVNVTDSATGLPITDVTVTVSMTDPGHPAYAYNYTIPAGENTFSLALPDGGATATFTVGSQGYGSTKSYTINGIAFANNVVAATFENKTGYLAIVSGSLQRAFGTYRNFTLDASTPANDYIVVLSSDGDVSGQVYNAASSTISFASVESSQQGGRMTVLVPSALSNGFSVDINGSRVQSSTSGGGLVNRLAFNVPSGKSMVTINLARTATTAASGTGSAGSTSSSAFNSSSGSSGAITTSSQGAQPFGQLQLIAVGVVLVLGIALAAIVVRKRARKY